MSEKSVFIPARLKSGVINGHVTGAADIIDDVLDKTQDVINQEQGEDIAQLREDVDTINSKIPEEASPSNQLADKAFVNTQVTTERNRATAAEQALSDALSQESSRAQAAEEANANAIAAETERAETAESTLQSNIDAENIRATGAEATLQSNIDAEETRAKSAENTIAGDLSAEETRAKAAERQNSDDIALINSKIPSQASDSNQLADKDFVNSTVSTATADFKGTYNSLQELEAVTADNNDYGFVIAVDAAGNTVYNRYKYNGTQWLFEYALNNSSFTAEQWAAINSALTSSHKTKLDALPTNDQLNDLLNLKQDNISDLETIRQGAASGATAYQKPSTGIPSSDMASDVQVSLGKADSAYQKPSTGIPSTDMSASVQESLGKADTALQEHQDITGKADKATTVTSIDYDNTKLTKTINGTTSDIVTVATLKQDMGLSNVADIDQSKAVKSFVVEEGTVTYTCLDDTTGTFTIPTFRASGSQAAAGLVPKPSTTAGTAKFLCEDGTWKQPSGGGGGGYVLPIASASELGGVKIGSGVAIDNDGILSVTVDIFQNVYIGTGNSEQDVMIPANLHATLRKGEAVPVTSSDAALFVILPSSFYPTVMMEGIRIPMTAQQDVSHEGYACKVLKSDNTFTGNFNVILM